jgi:hypothetical protein
MSASVPAKCQRAFAVSALVLSIYDWILLSGDGISYYYLSNNKPLNDFFRICDNCKVTVDVGEMYLLFCKFPLIEGCHS